MRDARAGAWLDRLTHDLRDAWRGLRRTPAVTATAVALIALVVGGNTTIYSLVHALIAKPSPGVTADRLVTLAMRQTLGASRARIVGTLLAEAS